MSSRREELESNLHHVRMEISSYSPTLIVVTKTYPVSDALLLEELGVENFGENRSSEGAEKAAVVSAHWHFQGQVQSKKIKEILSWADHVHSLDDVAHAQKFSRALEETGRTCEFFLQLSLDGNPARGGLAERDLFEAATVMQGLPGIAIAGIMCVPPVDSPSVSAFSTIQRIHEKFISEFPHSKALSAGMSGDYLIALNHGATHIRVGSKILGQRQYH